MRAAAVAALLAAGLIGASGCRASPDHITDWEPLPPPPASAERVALAVGPLALGYRPASPEPPCPNGFRNELDAALVRELLVQRLAGSEHFASVAAVGEAPGLSLSDPRWRGDEGDDVSPEILARRALLAEAAEAGADHLLWLRINNARVTFEERNDLFIWSFITWYLFIFPGWMIRDETYAAIVNADAFLIEVATGTVLRTDRLKIEVRRDFNDFDRGFWHILDILRAPDCLDEEDWVGIAEWLRKPTAHALVGEASAWVTRP